MEPSNQDLRELAKRRVRARTGFVIHLLMYVIVNTGLVLIWRFSGASYPWFLWPLFGWGIGIVSHAIALVFGPDSPHEERAIERELERHRPHHPT
jgi:hypothetical protein